MIAHPIHLPIKVTDFLREIPNGKFNFQFSFCDVLSENIDQLDPSMGVKALPFENTGNWPKFLCSLAKQI